MKLYDLINPTYLVNLFTFYGGGGGGKGGGQTQPPPPPAAPPPSAATPMKNPNSATGGDPQSDTMSQREGTRSLRIDLNGDSGGGSGGGSASGLNIPS